MSIADTLTRLSTARDDIITALTGKGVTATGHGFEDFPSDIAAIDQGGGGGGGEWTTFKHNAFDTYTIYTVSNQWTVMDNGNWAYVTSNGQNSNNSQFYVNPKFAYSSIKNKTCRISWNITSDEIDSFPEAITNAYANIQLLLSSVQNQTGNANSTRVAYVNIATSNNVLGTHTYEFVPSTLFAGQAEGAYFGWQIGFRTNVSDQKLNVMKFDFEVQDSGDEPVVVPSGWTLLDSKDVTVNTTSTSVAQVTTIACGVAAYTADKMVYVKIRDKAGARAGYFVGSDSIFFNPQVANGGTSSQTYAARTIFRMSSSNVYAVYTAATTTGYGVYPASIDSAGVVTISSRYNSSYSLTINGTYNVEVYTLDYAPTTGNPFNYSYSS